MKKEMMVLLIITFIAVALINPVKLFAAESKEEVSHGGDIIYDMPVKAVLFSHKVHVEEIGMGCDSCHDGIFQMESLAVQKQADFTMEGLGKGKYCGACHEGSMAFDSDSQCARCHIGVKGYNRSQGIKSGG